MFTKINNQQSDNFKLTYHDINFAIYASASVFKISESPWLVMANIDTL
jgi:hypothetical protein